MLKSFVLFIIAGLAEIGGGYLVWLWLRENRAAYLGLLGGLVLVLYGVIPTFQSEANFGRIYAAYGGIFIIMSTFWGWWVDGKVPDLYDWLGAAVCMAGIAIIMWGPRE
ncbi:MAG: YnfA family protein [Bacillota bacterium]